MKNTFLTLLSIALLSLCTTSCSKDDDGKTSPYTQEQMATMKVLHGSFSNTPDIMTGNIKTTFVFTETFLDGPKNITTTNVYEEKSERPIHGYLTYKLELNSNPYFEEQMAYYLHINGTVMTLYHTNSNKTISLNRSPETYKIIIRNDNEIRFFDTDSPLDPGQYYNRDY